MELIETLGDLYRHMEWADAVEWMAIRSLVGEDVGLRDKIHHLHVVQRAFFAIWTAQAADMKISSLLAI